MYTVKDTEGNIIVICSRLKDAEAMTATVGNEPKRTIITQQPQAKKV